MSESFLGSEHTLTHWQPVSVTLYKRFKPSVCLKGSFEIKSVNSDATFCLTDVCSVFVNVCFVINMIKTEAGGPAHISICSFMCSQVCTLEEQQTHFTRSGHSFIEGPRASVFSVHFTDTFLSQCLT